MDNDAKRAVTHAEGLKRERDEAVRNLAQSIRFEVQEQTEVSPEFADELEEIAADRFGPLLESLADAGVEAVEEIEPPKEQTGP